MRKLLIANRGEIAIRIAQAAASAGIQSVSVYSEDDVQALHTKQTCESASLKGMGAAAYLDQNQLLKVAANYGCDAIHPGYGFLSENSDFARAIEKQGLIFIGPSAETLDVFGDKAAARALATRLDIPLLPGSKAAVTLKQAQDFFESLGGVPIIIKALAGGGGRGMRVVNTAKEVAEKYQQSQAEAKMAFGKDQVYVERYIAKAQHIEVQIIGDGTGAISHAWERECSLQRRHQKCEEIAPAPDLDAGLREQILAAAVKLAKDTKYKNIGTFEFLVDEDGCFFFMEANPRIQVEHTVTETVTGLDLVQIQLSIAQGKTLIELGLTQDKIPAPQGLAVQARINLETITSSGDVQPSNGKITAYEVPCGSNIRVDGCGYSGYTPSPRFDTLLAKLIVHSVQDKPSDDLKAGMSELYRALCSFRISGVDTNISFLQNLLSREDVQNGNFHTQYIDSNIADIVTQRTIHPKFYIEVQESSNAQDSAQFSTAHLTAPENTVPVLAPMQGIIIELSADKGVVIGTNDGIIVMESMKMQHVINPPQSGKVVQWCVEAEQLVQAGDIIAFLEPVDHEDTKKTKAKIDLNTPRADLAEVLHRQSLTQDVARPDAVKKRHAKQQRTARENIADLCDKDSFKEIGSLAIAAQRTRRSLEDLIRKTPADGIVTGFGIINGDDFANADLCGVLHYDYTVLAGTQGVKNHAKTDRILEIAKTNKRPIVFFTEGGGGRPGDVDVQTIGGLYIKSFTLFASMSGLVPLIGIVSGNCFAGNAAFLGCCDVIIATENASIGMGGPAMTEGGGLGIVRPADVGPIDMQSKNGVVDIRVKDEEQAVLMAKKYLSIFQGELAEWDCADQRILRHVVPENRLHVYDVHDVITALIDTDTLIELRAEFGVGMVTAFARIEGKAVGIIANNPLHLAGAIDKDGADKAARFMQLCDAFDIPLLFLCDTPGIMVGVESEKTGHVRHCTRLFVTGANLKVPFMTIVLRKAYGLGAMAMAGGGFHAGNAALAWPTGEFGGMGLEGAVQLGFKKELAAIEDPKARQELFNTMVAKMYETGKALNTASLFEIDDVIDPQDSRACISTHLLSAARPLSRTHKKRPNIDTW
ncbi:MAG: biotin/lipoyl-binding protein [Robiginitomaculum sp.]|nr:biotin/lipoyl-binding protein [Robiginitomaculum sp.]